VQALAPAAAFHDAAGVLVNDLDLELAGLVTRDNHVLLVAVVERARADSLDQVVDQLAVLGEVEVLDAELFLGERHALFRRMGGMHLLVELVVRALLHAIDDAGEGEIGLGGFLGLARDNQPACAPRR